MIASGYIHPERSLYYLGAKLIEVLNEHDGELFDYFEAFQQLRAKTPITISLYTLTLDWMFLLGLISNSDDGLLKKCF